jgi:hypothetical protein
MSDEPTTTEPTSAEPTTTSVVVQRPYKVTWLGVGYFAHQIVDVPHHVAREWMKHGWVAPCEPMPGVAEPVDPVGTPVADEPVEPVKAAMR